MRVVSHVHSLKRRVGASPCAQSTLDIFPLCAVRPRLLGEDQANGEDQVNGEDQANAMMMIATAVSAQPLSFTDSYSALQHPDEHVEGFSVHAVHLAEYDSEGQPVGLHRRQLRFDDHPPRRRLQYAPFSATENSRDRVIALMKLNVAAYPGTGDTTIDRTWCQEVMDGILSENRQVYQAGTGVTKAQDDAANDAVNAAAKADMNVTDELKNTGWFERFSPSATAMYTTGVAAIEWVREDVTVLVFRGSYTKGDLGGIENWFFDYVLERSTTRMREAWTEDANLTWTSEMQARHDKGDLFARTALRTTSLLLYDGTPSSGDFVDGIVAAVANDTALSSAITYDSTIAKATGYWTITKHLVDAVVDALPSGQALLLTGHSQGATRAQLASMYLTKSRGATFTTQTYAATGGACAARLMYNSDADILADVDPTVAHANIVDYTHPLDPWGNTVLGVDNGGSVCFWGNAGLQAADSALEYCSRVYGYTGPTLIAAQGGVYLPGGADSDVGLNFRRCRYFTHDAEATLLALQQSGVVDADGTTDGGCRATPLIAAADTSSTGCPTGEWSDDEEWLLIGLVVGLTTPGCCCCAALIYLIVKKMKKKKSIAPT